MCVRTLDGVNAVSFRNKFDSLDRRRTGYVTGKELKKVAPFPLVVLPLLCSCGSLSDALQVAVPLRGGLRPSAVLWPGGGGPGHRVIN